MDSAASDETELPATELPAAEPPPAEPPATRQSDSHGCEPGPDARIAGFGDNAHFWAESAAWTRPAVVDEPEHELRPWQLDRTQAPVATKIVVAGGFGVGKTTLVTTASEITPLETEALMTEASTDTDDLTATPGKATTTVAMDFGRLTLDDDLVLYLFGTPGQQRFWFMWDDLARGAIGAVVLVDTRRLPDCFPVLDYFEGCGMPYMVAVNHFEGTEKYAAEDVREALTVAPHIPVMIMDARLRIPVIDTLLALVGHALASTRCKAWSQCPRVGDQFAARQPGLRSSRHPHCRQAAVSSRRRSRDAQSTHRRSRPVRAPARPRTPVPWV